MLHLKHSFFSDNGSATVYNKWRIEKRRQENKTASVSPVTITKYKDKYIPHPKTNEIREIREQWHCYSAKISFNISRTSEQTFKDLRKPDKLAELKQIARNKYTLGKTMLLIVTLLWLQSTTAYVVNNMERINKRRYNGHVEGVLRATIEVHWNMVMDTIQGKELHEHSHQNWRGKAVYL